MMMPDLLDQRYGKRHDACACHELAEDLETKLHLEGPGHCGDEVAFVIMEVVHQVQAAIDAVRAGWTMGLC